MVVMKTELERSRKRAAEVIRSHISFLVTSHVSPGGDAVGSVLAVGHLLDRLGKKCTLLNEDPVPRVLAFLAGSERIRPPGTGTEGATAAIVLDCGSLDRTGSVQAVISSVDTIVNVDHHVSNDGFGHVNLVDPCAASAGEIVVSLFDELGIPLSGAAEALYTSILTDTGLFSQANTTAATHEVAARLISEGVRPEQVAGRVMDCATFEARKLLGLALRSMERGCGGRLAWLSVTRGMLRETGAIMEDTERFVNFARSIPGVEVAALFRELEASLVGVSLRSRGTLDVNSAAVSLGGGGHRLAAGCRLKGTLEEVQGQVIGRLEAELAG